MNSMATKLQKHELVIDVIRLISLLVSVIGMVWAVLMATKII